MGLALTGRRSPQSHRYLCSWGLTPLPPLSNSNYFGYIRCQGTEAPTMSALLFPGKANRLLRVRKLQ
ncbi:hypothetical protein DZF04_14385 [Salmonella enterica]|uniref:Uncharacterized protein n=1 Tax=Salmonella senftenberg TaxID=28150 RepID=A0A401AWS0_SALSE|nr:hypothetical protein C6648_17080 [Salmonella enterica]AWE24219.1 hypothetical protein A1D48_07420 [Salmonella enterica subsp. enterica serovar Senftenberg]AWE37858.1 hypothetical protein AV984_07425 [Salmonella enterica subsp. enterica serovar Senftenberg str. 361154004]EBF1862181.1 hypothetical protein [Salmonella enterica subsp. enterica serovar Heidelberg]EBH8706037.1 hypothetical protein [Salmonella enterica subsp. enterica serovar Newport]EBZ1845867.1 hypothetical protein [Salmonella e